MTVVLMKIQSIKSLIDSWPSRKVLAEEVNAILPFGMKTVSADQVHKWAANGAIRATYQIYVLKAAQARGFDVSAEALMLMHAHAANDTPDTERAG